MSTMSLTITAAAAEPWLLRAWWALKNSWVLARRSVARIAREPEQLLDVTIQPVIFVLLFTYVFGSAIHLPGGGSYHQFLISGMFGMTMAGTAPGTAVGLPADMSTGLVRRLRVAADRAVGGAGRPHHVRPGHPGARHRGARRHRPARGLADRARHRQCAAGRRAVAAVRVRDDLGRRVRGHGLAQPGKRAGAGVRAVPAAVVRVQRVRAHPGHARLAA